MESVIFLITILLLAPWAIFAHGAEAASAPVSIVQNLALLLHIITAVFMAWPLYALITVNGTQNGVTDLKRYLLKT